MTLLIVLVLCVVTACLTAWLVWSLQSQTEYLRSQIRLKDSQLSDLQNKILSRDPMTYQILSQPQLSPLAFEPVQPTGTDVDEYEKYMRSIHGEEFDPNDPSLVQDRQDLFG